MTLRLPPLPLIAANSPAIKAALEAHERAVLEAVAAHFAEKALAKDVSGDMWDKAIACAYANVANELRAAVTQPRYS
jgi:hypothetical protein